ncbi:MAG: ATP-dependent DNA helicase [Saprospiraceae bacterium]|nr:ATP-dependent DNA helicase [Saprospiraceae bacterium]
MTFEEKLNSLNTNQRHAVDAIEGPVMVIAGPGTGKTEILSLRIGNIIQKTDTPPSGILCLTYTDAASSEMRHRLIEYIGPEAYKIHVSTFHGFCNLVIQENPGVFQQARELEPISEIERFKLLQKLIDSFDETHQLKKFKGLTYSDWKRLHELFMTMKKENWKPEFMHRQIEEYIERMRHSEEFIYKRKTGEFKVGDLKIKDFTEKVLNRMDVLKAAVNEYDHYNALMAAEGKYDFEDMLLWVNDTFDTNPDLLANYQERFLYFLVDEFQDTNGIQMSILSKLIDHEWLEQPNIFVVGDDDQAIFRFQGANVENLISFHTKYQPEVILLEENYRSSQLILDAARVIMDPVEESAMKQILEKNKKLLASGKHSTHDLRVHINEYPTPTYENADIFHQLKRWHEEKHDGSFAVLYTKHELGRELGQALKGASIPFQIAKTVDALNHQLISHLVDILTCINQLSEGANNNDAQLYRVLHLTYLEPRPYDLQKIMLAFTGKDRKDTTSFYGWISDPAKLDLLSLRDRPWIERIAKLLDESITAYHSMTLMSFVEWVTHHYGMMPWVLKQPEKFTHLYALKTFYTFIDLEASGKASFRIPDLLEICNLMKSYDIRLPIQSLAPPPKGIFLSSLHGAKGLEYEKVVIKNITENEWEKKRAYNQMFSLPDNLVRQQSLSTHIESGADINDQDRRRLLYVGMTRAKYDLTLTHARKKDDGKDLVPSLYLTEIQNANKDVIAHKPEIDENLQAEYLVYLMSGEQRADLLLDEAEIQDRVKNFVLNVSALNKYLECPLAFYYEKILVIPSGQQVYLIFGTGLHEALQLLFRKKFEERELAAGKEYLLRIYELYMDRHKHRLTAKEAMDYTTYGKMVLDKYYDHYNATWSEDIQYDTEYKIKDIHIQGVPVSGFIDRIDKRDHSIIVYDYKSGKTDKFSKKLKRPDDKDPVGGDYWRQMVFYDLMLSQDLKYRSHMDHSWLQALEPEKDGSFKQHRVNVTDEDRTLVTGQILDTYQKIQAMEFTKGCGKCQWCEMHGIVAIPADNEEVME